MLWKGKELKTYGDIGKAMIKVKTREEAAEFLRLYSAESPYAKQNIGYLAGYYSSEDRARIYELFEIRSLAEWTQHT